MQNLRQQIHQAFLNVSKICDQFYRKFPHYANPYHPSPYLYNNNNSGNYSKSNSFRNNQQGNNYGYNDSNHNNMNSYRPSKKQSKQVKVGQKKQQQKKVKQQARQQKLRQMRLQVKSKMRTDARYRQKPKYPTSPYFRFLQVMRQDPQNQQILKKSTNRQFTQIMGQRWRSMNEIQKQPYISGFAKSKAKYDKDIKVFYQKYPDLSPKWRLNQYEKQARQSYLNPQQRNQNVIEDLQQNGFEQFTPQIKEGQTNHHQDSFDEKNYQQIQENERQRQYKYNQN